MSEARLPDKWISGMAAAAPVSEEAPEVLRRRLVAVADRVGEVIKSSGRDDEAVHQLRVSTRRAQATILSFKPWLRKARRRRIKKVLKRLRATAGVVRMCDVHRRLLGASLAAEGNLASDRPTCEFAMVMLSKEREVALAALVQAARRVPVKRLTIAASRLLMRIDCDRGSEGSADQATSLQASVRSAGHAALAEIAGEFQSAAAMDLACRENLHQLRLCGKRLRYALEIFGATEENPQPLAQLADRLSALQERLGEVNDHHEVADRLLRYAADAASSIIDHGVENSVIADDLRTLADRFENRCASLAGEFLEWWRSDDASEFHQLIGMLAEREPAPYDDGRLPDVVVLARQHSVNGEHGPAAANATSSLGNDRGTDPEQ